jgi:hypothetical protein
MAKSSPDLAEYRRAERLIAAYLGVPPKLHDTGLRRLEFSLPAHPLAG